MRKAVESSFARRSSTASLPLLITDLLITFIDFPPENGQPVLNAPMAIHLFRAKIHRLDLASDCTSSRN